MPVLAFSRRSLTVNHFSVIAINGTDRGISAVDVIVEVLRGDVSSAAFAVVFQDIHAVDDIAFGHCQPQTALGFAIRINLIELRNVLFRAENHDTTGATLQQIHVRYLIK